MKYPIFILVALLFFGTVIGIIVFFLGPTHPTETLTSPERTTVTGFPKMKVKAYVVALGDNGKMGKLIGCGDSLVPTIVEIDPTKDLIRGGLDGLFSLKDKTQEEIGYYNSLSHSHLSVDKVIQTEKHGDVYLKGTVSLGGVCDEPRLKEQITQTALQFPAMNTVTIFLNGVPLDEVISQKGQ